jgi:tungstate transport system ATP-binding protein
MKKLDPAYHLKDIQHYYDNKKVLDIRELKINPGTITGLTGPNGSGKSTLLKLLAFTQRPSMGQILYKGHKAVPFSPNVRSKVTLLTQKPYLLKRTVFENIAYGLRIRKDTENIEKRIQKALLSVGLDHKSFASRKWHELSGGEAQRVAMAARLILKPEVLLLDEPVASVDTKSAGLIRRASLEARDRFGCTLIVASHDLQWLYSISDNQLSIFKGNIFSTGMENIITGPFETMDTDRNKQWLIKPLENGQSITLKAPDSEACTAVVRKDNISIALEKQADSHNLNQLEGHLTTMILEKKTGHIMADISIDDLSFVLRLTPDQISSLTLYPGKKVTLKFNTDDVEWI